MMKRVFVCSPLRPIAGRTQGQNQDLALRLCEAAVRSGYAPFAPHIFYTQMLDDADPAERAMGIGAGTAWLAASDELWVYGNYGVSQGMRAEIEYADRQLMFVNAAPLAWAKIT